MPEIGEIKQGRKIGYKCKEKYIWNACQQCGKERWVQLAKGKPSHKFCIPCAHSSLQYRARLSETHRGNKNSHWNGGRTHLSEGYVRIWLSPDDFFYPMARKNNYVLEHRLVMAKSLGRCLQSWELVHHKGIRYTDIRNRSDNLIDNLELTIRGQHSRAHSKGYRDGYQKGFSDGQASQIKELKQELRLIQWQNKELLEELKKYIIIET